MYVDPHLVNRIVSGFLKERRGLPFFSEAMVFDEEIINYYLLLFYSLENSATRLESESLLLELITLLVDRHAQEGIKVKPPQKERKAVDQIRDYITAFHAQNISLQEMASLVALSPYHLTRIFCKEIGMPPHAFQTQVRIAHAKRLIRANVPLSDVAALTGFADQSHFIRQFKRLMKITPGAYLKPARTFYTEFPVASNLSD